MADDRSRRSRRKRVWIGSALALVLVLVSTTAAAGFSLSSANVYFSIGSGSGRVCAKGISGVNIDEQNLQFNALAYNYSRKASDCLSHYTVPEDLFQNKNDLWIGGFPAIHCESSSWDQGLSSNSGYEYDTVNFYDWPLCGSPYFYFTNSQHKYWYPFAWFSGSESSPAEHCQTYC